MNGLEFLGFGKSVPKTIVTNDDLSKIVDTSDEWVFARTGIKSRHFAKTESNAQLASQAALQAINEAGLTPQDISLCIVATFSVDNFTPSVSCEVSEKLNFKNDTICFDLNAACSGFIYALNVAKNMLCNDKNKYALVIGSEVISRYMDMSDRSTCILFGDGAGAAVVKASDSHPFYFLGGCIPDKNVLFCDTQSKSIKMDGQAVFRFAVDIIPKCITDILQQNDLCLDDITHIVCHQANKRIIEFAAKRLKADFSKFFLNLDRYGNTSAASIPIALQEMTINKGDKIICVGFGAGLTYGATLLTF